MKDAPGAALIASTIIADCMKWMIKPSVKLSFSGIKPYVYHLREAEASIVHQVSEEEVSRILRMTEIHNVGVKAGDRISGKKLLLLSDMPVSKVRFGMPEFSSGRHKRQSLELKSKEKSIAFVISTWSGENIVPPEPMRYLSCLYSL